MNTETSQIEIPRSQITPRDIADFDVLRAKVYKTTEDGSGDRTTQLTELADLVDVKAPNGGEPISLHNAVMRALQERAANPVEKRGYVFTLDVNGNIVGISSINRLPENKAAIARAKEMERRVPSGPKKNRSSFKVDPRRTYPRRHRAA